jgi:hypothetical protein
VLCQSSNDCGIDWFKDQREEDKDVATIVHLTKINASESELNKAELYLANGIF